MDRGRERSPPRRARSPPRDDSRRRPYDDSDDRGARRYDGARDGGGGGDWRRGRDADGARRHDDRRHDDRPRYDDDDRRRRYDDDDRRNGGGSSSSSRRYDGDRDRARDAGRGYDDDYGRRPRSRSRDRPLPPRRDGGGGDAKPAAAAAAASAGPVIPEHVRAAIAAMKEGRGAAPSPAPASPPRSPLAPPPPLPAPAAPPAAAAAAPPPPPPAAAAPPAPQPTLLPAPNTKADFGLSGALAGDAATGATVNGVTLKWSEPPDAAVPPRDGPKWQLHGFKGADALGEPLPVHRQSAYLVGRDRRVADIPADHPSCSSQHAVLQFRGVVERARDEDGEENPFAPAVKVVKPYVLDLESTNGTWLNGTRLPPARYVELRPKDVLRFGSSSREYVLMHDRMV